MRLSTIYMDNHATTPLDPRVQAAMAPYLSEAYGNPSSRTHPYGWQADMAIQKARQQTAQALNTEAQHIIFTSGATESNNLALFGHMATLEKPSHLIVGATEHKAVLEVATQIAEMGHEITVLEVDQYGMISRDRLESALRPNTRMVSIMWANNEIGTINPIHELAKLTRERGIVFHCDAVQAVGRIPIDLKETPIDLLSLSGHKIYGPKGIGALYVQRDRTPIKPLFYGGSQEWGVRPGTHNVPAIVGLGAAMELAAHELAAETHRLGLLRDHLVRAVLAEVPSARLNGHPKQRLAGNISLSFAGLHSDLFSLGLRGVACSSGSACNSGSGHISHVLEALRIEPAIARATLRLGLGRFTTTEEVHLVTQKILEMAAKNHDISVG